MMATIWHFAESMGPFNSIWEAYECFGILWMLGPWWFNAVMFLLKFLIAVSEAKVAGLRAAGGAIGPGGKEQMEILLRTGTKAELQKAKAASLFWSAMATVTPYAIIALPIMVTHVSV